LIAAQAVDPFSHPVPASHMMLTSKYGGKPLSKRETYTTNIGCKDCGNQGTAKFSEFENPVYARGNLNTVAEDAGEGFALNGKAGSGLSCTKCGSLNVVQV